MFVLKQFLLKYENQIIPVFESNETNEHCIANMDNSLERMIVHGLCQYLDINSKSIITYYKNSIFFFNNISYDLSLKAIEINRVQF